MNPRPATALALVAALLSLAFYSNNLRAEEPSRTLEEIVVTAEFRETNLAKYAGSATLILPNEDSTVVNHLEEVLNRAANVNFSSGASRGRFVQIRGIGERGQFDEPLNASVGLIVDGVDLSGIGAAATLFDVQQIEVLRGPQGTLYGANALAGLINIVTPAASEEFEASVRLDAADHNAFGLGAVVSGPLSDNLGYRISAQRYRDDGFVENNFLGRSNTANRDENTVRAKLDYTGERVDWRLSAGWIDVDNGYDGFSLDNVRDTITDNPGFDRQETLYGAFSLGAALTEAIRLEASASIADSDIDYAFDEDWTFTGFDPFGFTSFDRYIRDRTTTTLEARLVSEPGSGVLGWDWAAGVFLLDQEVDLTRIYTFLPGPFDSSFEIERRAFYGEISRALSERWQLTLGARIERHSSEYEDSNGVELDPSDTLFGGRVLLQYDLAEAGLLYFGLTQGYSASGFNTDGSLEADLREFEEETLWNAEIGYRGSFDNGRFNVAATLFNMRRDDIQIATATTRPVGDGSGAVQFIQLTSNAAEGFNRGVELELDYTPVEALTLFANLGFLDTEYDDFVDANGIAQDGRDQAQAPQYQFWAGFDWRIAPRWNLRLELEGKDEFFFSDSHDERSDAYELLNASLSYTADRWRVRAWGRNLADEEYFVRGFFFGNDPRDLFTAREFTQLGDPRQVGVSVEFDF